MIKIKRKRFSKSYSPYNVVIKENIILRKCEDDSARNPFRKLERSDSNPCSDRTNIESLQETVGLKLEYLSSEIAFEAPRFSTNVLETIKINEDQVDTKQRLLDYPPDASLKSKLRITSKNPLDKFLPSDSDSSLIKAPLMSTKESSDSFADYLHYWIFPELPWLSMFPRKESFTSSKPSLSEEMQKSVYNSWISSLISCFASLKAGTTPSFYLCAPQFTVLFVKSGSIVEARVSPTSKEFRSALTNEGINFEMPLHPGDNAIVDESEPEKDAGPPDEELDNEPDADEECPESWLNSLGVDRSKIPIVAVTKSVKQKQRQIDGSFRSTVVVSSLEEVFGLFNFLMEYKGCVSPVGEMAGIPPTILSPCPFVGATLKKLKAIHSTFQQFDEKHYSLEITGPLLSPLVHGMCNSLCQQSIDYCAFFKTCAKTEGFNSSGKAVQEFSFSTGSGFEVVYIES